MVKNITIVLPGIVSKRNLILLILFAIPFLLNAKEYVFQSERNIPIIKSVDVLIIGGTVPAVEAAVAAANKGCSVFLVESKSYLGEDLCATLRLNRDTDQRKKTELENQIFGNSDITTPMRVKGVLSNSLAKAGVDFIFGSFVTDVVWDENDELAGVAIANRAGRQTILAKTIIDASQYAVVCNLAGAQFRPLSNKSIAFERTIVLPGTDDKKPCYKVEKLKLDVPDFSFKSFAEAEQKARKLTYKSSQLRAAESLFFLPENTVVSKAGKKEWEQSDNKLDHFQAQRFNNLFVLNNFSDVPEEVKRNGELTAWGKELGNYISVTFKYKLTSNNLTIKSTLFSAKKGDVKEVLNGLRPVKSDLPSLKQSETGIPIIGNYDVVVIGGGTSGAPAAISAARMGMKVLVVEYLEGLGGIGTLGMIGKPYHGKKVGFAKEVPFPDGNIEPKMEWYRHELDKADADIWLGSIGCGAYVEKNRVTGAVVVTPFGRGVVEAKVVIDATGNADVAIAAGAGYRYGSIEKNDIAIQGTGFSSRPLKGNYYNSDYLLVDESDMKDIWRSIVSVHITKDKEDQFDAVPLVQNREHRRILGDFTLNYLDQIAGRTYPDAIVYSGSDYDSHGYPSSTYFALLPHDELSKKENHPAPGGTCFTPYRCLLSKGINGLLVTGLGISMDRDASAMVRMQFDMANQGYAAGLAASMAISEDIDLREINIRDLQQVLVDKGNIPSEVLEMEDNFPLSKDEIKQAVSNYGKARNPDTAGHALAIILSHKNKAIPLVKKAYKQASGQSKLLYAQFLGICGEPDGLLTLIDELNKFEKWDEKIYQGSMADFAHLPTPVDQVILALGYSGDKAVLPELLKMLEKLDSKVTLSHHRSLALAFEKLKDPSACESIYRLLQKPEMQGHTILELDDAITELNNNGKGPNPIKNSSLNKRSKALREIVWARALYNCGDYNGLGKSILESYQKDMRGLFVRHAEQIL